MNKDLPKILLHHYEQLVEENKVLKARIKEMEDENHGNRETVRAFLHDCAGIRRRLYDVGDAEHSGASRAAE